MPADDVPDGYHGGRLGRGSWPLLLTLHHDLKLREIVPYSASVHASVMAGIAIHMLIAVIFGIPIVHAARAFTPTRRQVHAEPLIVVSMLVAFGWRIFSFCCPSSIKASSP